MKETSLMKETLMQISEVNRTYENDSGDYINLSGVGNLKKYLMVSQLKNGRGVIHIQQDTSKKSKKNLKKGERKKLERHTLTSYAKRQIRNAGSMLQWMVENKTDVYSTLMTTLTYGRAVPDHQTAKRHLNTFLTRCRQKGYLQHYVWVAQLQTGKRAKEKGIKSYRADNGAAIHFHILHCTYKGAELQINNAQNKFRTIWKGIVNKWEKKTGNNVQNIGGVDIRAVYNASNYVSRYISNESETIIGNMWNMSADMRKEIVSEKQIIEVDKNAYYSLSRIVSSKRLYENEIQPITKEIKKIKIREVSHHTISFKMWNDEPIIISDNVNAVIKEIRRIERNNKIICNNVKPATNNLILETKINHIAQTDVGKKHTEVKQLVT